MFRHSSTQVINQAFSSTPLSEPPASIFFQRLEAPDKREPEAGCSCIPYKTRFYAIPNSKVPR
jgi:hypothetical protein